MQGDPPARVDKDVPAELVDVAGRPAQAAALAQEIEVGAPGSGAPDLPAASPPHFEGSIGGSRGVDQERPRQVRLAHVLLGLVPALEGDDEDRQTELLDLLGVRPQLRDVFSAGQSAEVAMEDEQHPPPAIVRESMGPSRRVLERQRRRFTPDQ